MIDNGTDVWLKITGTLAQAMAVLRGPDLSLILRKDQDGNDELGNAFNHDIALLYHENLMTAHPVWDHSNPNIPVKVTPAAFGGEHLMIRILNDDLRIKVRRELYETERDNNGDLVRKNLSRLAVVDAPPTVVWF